MFYHFPCRSYKSLVRIISKYFTFFGWHYKVYFLKSCDSLFLVYTNAIDFHILILTPVTSITHLLVLIDWYTYLFIYWMIIYWIKSYEYSSTYSITKIRLLLTRVNFDTKTWVYYDIHSFWYLSIFSFAPASLTPSLPLACPFLSLNSPLSCCHIMYFIVLISTCIPLDLSLSW